MDQKQALEALERELQALSYVVGFRVGSSYEAYVRIGDELQGVRTTGPFVTKALVRVAALALRSLVDLDTEPVSHASTNPGPLLDQLQHRVGKWVGEVFDYETRMNRPERALRLLEEAIEYAQAVDVSLELVHRCANHVYEKPVGEPAQELAGVAVTLLAAAESQEVSLGTVLYQELERIESAEMRASMHLRHEKKRQAGLSLREFCRDCLHRGSSLPTTLHPGGVCKVHHHDLRAGSTPETAPVEGGCKQFWSWPPLPDFPPPPHNPPEDVVRCNSCEHYGTGRDYVSPCLQGYTLTTWQERLPQECGAYARAHHAKGSDPCGCEQCVQYRVACTEERKRHRSLPVVTP